MSKYKYIKDLSLKENLDGSERILIQDDESTKQVGLDIIVDDVKKSSESRMTEIEMDLMYYEAQLSGKISRGEAGVITNSMLSQEVRESMTGGSVAVVGENAILNKNIADGQVSVDKTNFAEKGRNKFNGFFTLGYGLTGSYPNLVYSVVSNGVSVIFKTTPNTTYTVSKSDDVNRFGIALFENYPEVGTSVTRAVLRSDTDSTQKTLTVGKNENYMVIYMDNTGVIPTFLQIEEGEIKTEFEGYTTVKINLTDDSIPVIKPEMTSFAKSGKNLADPSFYLNNVYLAGDSSALRPMSSDGGYIYVFKGEKGKTYTISRSDDGDRYGLGVSIEKPEINVYLTRVLNSNTVKWTSKTVTLENEESYIVIGISSVSSNKKIEQLQIEEGDVKTDFEDYSTVKINLTDDSIPVVKPEMTSFIKPGKNLADPSFYLNNVYLAGDSSALRPMSSDGGYIYVFKGEKGKTYTISRSDDGDRYGLGVSIEKPEINVYLTRVLNSNTVKWTSKTVTLENEESYIVIGISSISSNKKIEQLQIEEGEKATSYSDFGNYALTIGFDPVDVEAVKLKNVAWFGDSISELQLLPHRVGDLLSYDIHDCSFAGSVMAYRDGGSYEKLGFLRISESIVLEDFTTQEEAIVQIELTGGGSNKRPNFNTLTSLDFNTIDAFVVLIGTNDYGAGSGTIDDFKNGMRRAIENVLGKYPHIQFYFITPIWRKGATSNNWRNYNLIDLVNAEIEVSNEYNFPVLDLYHKSGINNLNKSVYLNSDELHQTIKGDELLAEKIAKFISSC